MEKEEGKTSCSVVILLLSCLAPKSCSTLCNPMDLAHQAPSSMGFPRQEYWSGLFFSPTGALPDSGIEPMSPALAGGFLTTIPPRKPRVCVCGGAVSLTRYIFLKVPPSTGFMSLAVSWTKCLPWQSVSSWMFYSVSWDSLLSSLSLRPFFCFSLPPYSCQI